MKRKQFIQKAGLLAAGTIAAPYLLPTGRLFARTGAFKADYVVLVMFAGGVRQQEAVLQRYLDDSQGVNSVGNIMYNLLEGDAPTFKVVYGTTPGGGTDGSQPIPRILSQSIQKQGTLFKEMRAQSAGHYVGLNTLVTGNSGTSQGLKVRHSFPTNFEYLRRHNGFKATDTWFIGNGIGNSTPLLNCSKNIDYGLEYGANFFAPPITFGSYGKDILSNAKIYHPQEELGPMYKMKNFLDNTFKAEKGNLPGIRNTDDEKTKIKEFIRQTFQKAENGQIPFPPVSSNGDAFNVGYALEVMQNFKPRLLVLNMGAVDGCHSNFTGYLQALHRADHATGHIWNFIKTKMPAEYRDNCAMIVAPECGRNLNPNPIQDYNDWYAYDHSDANALRVWGAMVGKGVPQNTVIGNEANPVGRLTDITLTIADIFGIKDQVMNSGYIDGSARSLFDRI